LSTISSGVDTSGVIDAFNILLNEKTLIVPILTTFNQLLVSIQDSPPTIRLPCTLRFLVIGLLMPSSGACWEGFDCWRNLIQVIDRMNAYSVLAQWLSVLPKEQLSRILESLKDFLAQHLAQCPRLYSPVVIKTVKTIEVIWLASSRTKKLIFDEFYHQPVNNMIDLRIELHLWLDQGRSWCFTKDAPWMLHADVKTKFLRMNSRELMNREQIRAMQNATEFWGTTPVVSPLDIFLVLFVERPTLLMDTFRSIAQLKNPDLELKKPLKVVFKGEPAVDEGGVQREFFQLIVDELFDLSKGFFTSQNTFYWFNSGARDPSSLQAFSLTGVIFGLAIYNGNLLNVKFPSVVYKKLRGLKIGFEDLKDFDESLYSTLSNILTYEGNLEADMSLTFEYGDVLLCPNGENIPVTNANREEYCNLIAQYLLVDSVQRQ
jgi:hypothetical protein